MRLILGTRVTDYLPATGLFVVTAIFVATAYGYAPDSRAVPLGVGWVMLGLLALDLVSRTRTKMGLRMTRWLNPAAVSEHVGTEEATGTGRQVAAVAWVAGFAGALVAFGILYAVPLYVFAFINQQRQRSVLLAAAVAGGVTLVVWLLFAVLLRLELYPGALFGGA